jgi:hypothetical protein
MRGMTKTTTATRATFTIATTLLLAMTAPSVFVGVDNAAAFSELISLDSIQRLTTMDGQNTDTQVSSLRVTQSTEDGLEIQCEGNLKCEVIGDDTVIATSEEDNTTIVSTITSSATTTSTNQSSIAQFSNEFDVIDKQDLDAAIEGMVDRLLDEVSENLSSLSVSI